MWVHVHNILDTCNVVIFVGTTNPAFIKVLILLKISFYCSYIFRLVLQ